jgi:PPK2 family polyphosphate:nucleotide phosphotransferase
MARTRARPETLRKLLRVAPGRRVDLASVDPTETHGHRHAASDTELGAGLQNLTSLQERLYAESSRAVLIVLQGIDASGKDGTIRHVMRAFNPQGCPVTSFKVPSPAEAAHDFLWRIHQRVPAHGEIGIFNRSHYEEVVVTRVHGLVPRSVWSKRYGQINDFEQELSASGTTIVKFFLWISRDEQRRRLQSRYDDPTKRWKFALGDLDERGHWNDYVAAFEAMLSRTATSWAPWYVVPADHTWFRNLAVAEILGDILEELDPRYPEPEGLPANLTVE